MCPRPDDGHPAGESHHARRTDKSPTIERTITHGDNFSLPLARLLRVDSAETEGRNGLTRGLRCETDVRAQLRPRTADALGTPRHLLGNRTQFRGERIIEAPKTRATRRDMTEFISESSDELLFFILLIRSWELEVSLIDHRDMLELELTRN